MRFKVYKRCELHFFYVLENSFFFFELREFRKQLSFFLDIQ